MTDISSSDLVKKITKTMRDMYEKGWDERNSGNVSVLLEKEWVDEYLDGRDVITSYDLDFCVPSLEGKYFLVTGAGKYFKDAVYYPREGLGIVKIADEGSTAKLMWGFSGGGRPTSEFVAHLRSHEERLKTDPLNRVVLHSHPTNLICMSMVHDLDEREFTRTLWRMLAEAVIVFPDGIGILPFMCFGTKEIGQKTAEKIKSFRIVLWANHGIYGAGKDINEAFGLIDTVEKAAEVYLRTYGMETKNTLSDGDIIQVADYYGVKVKDGYL